MGGIGLDEPMQLLEVHAVVDADPEQPVATAQAADERVLEPAALDLVARDASRRLADAAARLVEQDEQLVARGVRSAGDGGRDDGRAMLRPLGPGVQRCPRCEEASSRGRVREGLRDVPVLLTAGRAEQMLRQVSKDGFEGVAVLVTDEGKGLIASFWESEEAAAAAAGFAAEALEEHTTLFRSPPGRDHYRVALAELPGVTVS